VPVIIRVRPIQGEEVSPVCKRLADVHRFRAVGRRACAHARLGVGDDWRVAVAPYRADRDDLCFWELRSKIGVEVADCLSDRSGYAELVVQPAAYHDEAQIVGYRRFSPL
jgi:hypothetical protein